MVKWLWRSPVRYWSTFILVLPCNKYIPFTQFAVLCELGVWLFFLFFYGALFASWSYHYSCYLPPPPSSSSFYYRMLRYIYMDPSVHHTIVISTRYLDWMVGCDFIYDNLCCIFVHLYIYCVQEERLNHRSRPFV